MKNALICFLKYPEPGYVKSRLAQSMGDEGAAEIYEAMAERIITEVYPLDNSYDLVLYYDAHHEVSQFQAWIGSSWAFFPQSNGDLGERMYEAFSQVMGKGYEKVAIIGTDCVGMNQEFMEELFTHLDEHDYVVGPSSDGGYYVLGMKSDSPWLFDGVEWSTNSVLETTLDKIEMRELKVHQLEEKIDVDTIEDLVALQEVLPEEHFLLKKIEHVAMNVVSLPPETDAQQFFD